MTGMIPMSNRTGDELVEQHPSGWAAYVAQVGPSLWMARLSAPLPMRVKWFASNADPSPAFFNSREEAVEYARRKLARMVAA